MIICCFTSLSILFKLYGDHGSVIMKKASYSHELNSTSNQDIVIQSQKSEAQPSGEVFTRVYLIKEIL